MTAVRWVFGTLGLCLLLASSASAAPDASFSFEPSSPTTKDRVRFFDASTHSNGTIVNWIWSFGDGAVSTDREPTHRYDEAGAYTVVLTVTDEEGDADATSLRIAVNAPAIDSVFGMPEWLYWVMPLVVSTILVGIGLLVLVKGQPLVYNRVFFLLTAFSASKGYTEAGIFFIRDNVSDPFTSGAFLVFASINRLLAFFYAPIFLWFVLVFPRPIRPWLKNGWRGAWTLLLALPFVINLAFPIVSTTAMQNIFNVYVSVLALAALGLLVFHAWETDSDEEKHRLQLLSGTFFLIVFSTIMVMLLQLAAARTHGLGRTSTGQTYEDLSNAFGTVASPVLEIIGLVLVMYGILRYQLLGVETLVKRVTRASMFAITIGTVFVIVSNTVEQLFQVTVLAGIPFDFIVAGFISALLMFPVQKLTERVANRLFPQAGSVAPDYLAKRRMEIYEAQLRYAMLDGHLKTKELTMLHALADSIELKLEELHKVVAKFPGLDVRFLDRLGAPVGALPISR